METSLNVLGLRLFICKLGKCFVTPSSISSSSFGDLMYGVDAGGFSVGGRKNGFLCGRADAGKGLWMPRRCAVEASDAQAEKNTGS